MKNQLHSGRGSALLVTLIITAALMVSLASYLSLIHVNLNASNRSAHLVVAMNVAETGLEEGMWSLNKIRSGVATGFDGWTKDDAATPKLATRIFTNIDEGSTTSGSSVTVQVSNYDLAAADKPMIKAHAVVGLGGSQKVEKWVEVVLDAPANAVPGSTAAPFPGLVAKRTIRFKGNNATVDSWNSDPDADPATVPVLYDPTDPARHNDKGFVGSLAITVDQILVQNADILGNVSTYQDSDLTNNVGPNGSILAFDSPGGTRIDPRRVSTDFVATLPDPAAPATTNYTLGTIGDSTTLPRVGDTPAADGKYYYTVSGINIKAGGKTPDTINVSGGNVILNVPYPYTVSIAGQGSIKIDSGASLEIFAAGDVSLAGLGVLNGTTTVPQAPISFKVWGLASDRDGNPETPDQNISIAGNGYLSGVVYAPNASVTINGNGDVFGSVVGSDITMTGNAAFHYDESLGTPSFGKKADTGKSALRIALWRELLTPAERVF